MNFTIVNCYRFSLWHCWSLLMLPMKRCCTYRDRDPSSLNTFFDDSLNDIAEKDLNTPNSPFFITSPYMCAESVSNLVRDKNLGHFISLCINIRSLANTRNFDNFLSLLNDLPICPTFLSITETINQKRPFLNLPNYGFYSVPRKTRKGGGVGTYIHENQSHWPREDLNKFEEGIFKSSLFELKINTVNIICGTIYRPPSSNAQTITEFMIILKNLLNLVKKKIKLIYIIVGSNFNLLNPDRNTDAFVDEMFSNGNYPLISKPTRISTSMTIIDNIWTKNLKFSISSAVLTDLVSNHFAIIQCTKLPNKNDNQTF